MLKRVLLNKVNIGEARKGVTAATGKEWTAYPVGIEVDGMWHNGFLFEKAFVDEVAAHRGKEMVLDMFEEEYQGQMQKKFQKANIEDVSSMLYNELRLRIEVLEKKAGIEFVPTIAPGTTDAPQKIEGNPYEVALRTLNKYLVDNKDKLPALLYENVDNWTKTEGIKSASVEQLKAALKKLEDNLLPF